MPVIRMNVVVASPTQWNPSVRVPELTVITFARWIVMDHLSRLCPATLDTIKTQWILL
jgi:hypothetical protein